MGMVGATGHMPQGRRPSISDRDEAAASGAVVKPAIIG
jgi:hypothetical protein